MVKVGEIVGLWVAVTKRLGVAVGLGLTVKVLVAVNVALA